MTAPTDLLAAYAQLAKERHARNLRVAIFVTVVAAVPASAIIGAGVAVLATYWGW